MTEFRDGFRLATLVLLGPGGELLGQLPPLKLTTPWFQEIGELVALVDERFGISPVILRLLATDTRELPQIRATYLGQVTGSEDLAPALRAWKGELDDHPLRLPYARPGGPAADLAWAASALMQAGQGEVIGKTQVRTWNLSSIWRLNTANDTFWLKHVPAFFAHEAGMLSALAAEAVPRLVAGGGTRILMAHLSGDDCYDATDEQQHHMIEQLVDLQWRWSSRCDELAAVGTPVIDDHELVRRIDSVVRRQGAALAFDHQALLRQFVASLPARLAALAECGIPTTLVHGDYHSGNWRGVDLDLAILDWGDCFIGHPLLDMGELPAPAHAHWLRCWQDRVPGADVGRAARLVAPVIHARLATVFQGFLVNIEPSERVYHDTDPLTCLYELVAALEAEAADGAPF